MMMKGKRERRPFLLVDRGILKINGGYRRKGRRSGKEEEERREKEGKKGEEIVPSC